MMATVALFLAAPRTMEGPPISIFSIVAASLAPERTVSANGYRLTTTRSNGLMPNFSSWAGMIGVGHIGENTGVDMRVERLDTAIEALGETGDLGLPR